MSDIDARLTTFGNVEDDTLKQMENCLAIEDDAIGVLCADNHVGYGQPVGGAVAYEQHISVAGVGYDIGCGNKAVRTDIMASDLIEGPGSGVEGAMDAIFDQISFGVGRNDGEVVDHPVLDMIASAPFEPQREMLDLARKQLGTVGGGNHYVDLFADEEGWLWIGVHFGSRGFGWKTCEGFRALSHDLPFNDRERRDRGQKVPREDMFAPPLVFSVDSELGQAYISAMDLAGAYAFAGRDVVVDKVAEILGATITREVHNHHNFAWRENHFGRDLWVCRKGCTPAFPGQEGFVGASMAEDAVILEGREGGTSKLALYSTVHGAGRQMSRTKAAGKIKFRKRYACADRECDRLFDIDGINPQNPPPKKGACPDHPEARVRKIKVRERVGEGVIDWPAALEDLRSKGIILRGGDAEEAPLAYKRLYQVLAQQGSTIEVTNNLRILGVAMAPSRIQDPYKD